MITKLFIFILLMISLVSIGSSSPTVRLNNGVDSNRLLDRPYVQLEETRFETMEGIYGAMAIHDDSGYTIVINVADTYQQLQNFTEEISSGVTVDLDNQWITIEEAGVYQVVWALSFGSATGGGKEYQVTPHLNNVTAIEECESHRKLGAGGDVGSMSGTCLFNLSANQNISLMMKNTGGTQDATGYTTNINVERLIMGANESAIKENHDELNNLNWSVAEHIIDDTIELNGNNIWNGNYIQTDRANVTHELVIGDTGYEVLFTPSPSLGLFVIDMTTSTKLVPFLDIRTKDDQFGTLIRESDGTGATSYMNIYVVDDSTDYTEFKQQAPWSNLGAKHLTINQYGNVGIGIVAGINRVFDVEGESRFKSGTATQQALEVQKIGTQSRDVIQFTNLNGDPVIRWDKDYNLNMSNKNIHMGNGSSSYPLFINRSSGGISAYFSENISASGYNTHSPRDLNYAGNYRETALQDPSEMLDIDGKIKRDFYTSQDKAVEYIYPYTTSRIINYQDRLYDESRVIINPETLLPEDDSPSPWYYVNKTEVITETDFSRPVPINATSISGMSYANRLLLAELYKEINELKAEVELLKAGRP
jgi:hypothetical protein